MRDRFEEALRERTSVIREYLEKITGKAQTDLASVAVDNTSKHLPNNEECLPELFTRVIEQASNKDGITFAASIGQDARYENSDSGPRII